MRFASRRARTQSAISAAEIEITNPDQQKQAIAGLNRDATNLNGQVDKTPDVQQTLQNQGELMSAMRDAGEAVARRIGDVADAKRDALLQVASESDDPQQKQQYLAEAEQWDESGRYRVGLQSAGGSLVGGIGGGLLGAAQSGAGSLVSALLANKLDAVSRQIADQKPTGNADLDKTLGNIVANVMSSVAGGVVGGTQGAQAAYNVDRFNRQTNDNEKKAIAEKAGSNKAEQERLVKAACYAVKCWAEYKPGSDEYTKHYVSQLEASQLQPEIDWVNQQKEAGLFKYTPGQKIGDAVKSDPVGVAKDAAKVVVGGVTAKTGVGLCTTGLGCTVGGWMAGFGLSEVVEGSTGLMNRYGGTASPGVNPLRFGFNQLAPQWGSTIYDGINFGMSILSLKAQVPLNVGIADGINRPASMFGVTIPRIDNVNLLPFIKQPWPYGTTQGVLLYGVGAKGAAVVNDVRQTGDEK
ncbi:hypothetical protein KPG66_01970 [Mycetohabitans sp. B2]|uniref:hypothetical protein n=1 Tax=Mycetohabitans sp. B2 TaxID=2841274 RepID=UPI001F2296BF|nr:hypothetical protein [Mycetohabitans sp. B2]MCF7694932.1 hypothetical protein [Mycetohabitans sp. B2]